MFKRDGFTRCPKCNRQFKNEHYGAHLSAHDREDTEKAAESQSNPYSSSSNFFDSSAPNLDATKNIGYVRREIGKYGSHASHDGFDDESES